MIKYNIAIIIIITLLYYNINFLIKKYNKRKIYIKQRTQSIEQFEGNNSICCLYAYYEKNDLYKNNLKYFLENGIINDVDYYIIINGNYTIKIHEKKNIKVYRRKNIGYDFGAYSYAIKYIKKEYNYYFFLNASVCGPYLKNNSKKWTLYFIELFNNNVKLVGTSINICTQKKIGIYNLLNIYKKDKPFTHIQSMFFVMNNEYFRYLKNTNFFNEDILNISDMNYVIAMKEIGLSQIALKNGWNINSILPKYKNINYIDIKEDFNNKSNNGDPYFINSYFGNTIDKYDAIFFKNSRF
jgi:hypothetical protein